MNIINVDERDIGPGDYLLMWDTGPWGTALVVDVKGADDELRLATLRRPFLYSLGCSDDVRYTPGVENYSICLKNGRMIRKWAEG